MRHLDTIMEMEDTVFDSIETSASGAEGALPLTEEMLTNWASGDLFGLSQNVGMGWRPDQLKGQEILILGTQGGIKAEDGSPLALGYHTGHWEVDLLMKEAAEELRQSGNIPFAGFVSDPCDGRSQGTKGMFDSLPFRNDASMVMRRLIRSLPRRKAVIGVATCDKGLPAMMMGLAASHDLPTVIVPGGVTLPPEIGEDAGKIQTIGARFAKQEITLREAAELGCRACATPGGGCQFLGTAASAQVVAEALGMTVPHGALAPSGQDIWKQMARQSVRAVMQAVSEGLVTKDIITDASIRNAMAVHAAFGGSTNLLLHIPAVAHAAGCRVPDIEDWKEINRKVPRLVSALPNGPYDHPTVRVYLAGGVPEVMLHLRRLGLLDEEVVSITGERLKDTLDWWEQSPRRQMVRDRLSEDGINPDDVIMPPAKAKATGMTSTITFPTGNIAPEGAIVKSTSIDREMLDENGVYYHKAPVKIFTSEKAVIKAIKSDQIEAGDIIILSGCGPSGTGMEETYQVTSALKHLPFGKHVTLITDARFSGVSTGACIGHAGPEALAGGPIGKLRDGDIVEVRIDCDKLDASIHFTGTEGDECGVEEGTAILAARDIHPELAPHQDLPDDTRLWAALQAVSGGTWKGSVYDVDKIIRTLHKGMEAEAAEKQKDPLEAESSEEYLKEGR
ncbi:YjhG/YagF family D-xylonate dehydratase [Alteribacter lacisalsi]|uniref:YjhG/YagF family D-xylonate dehydratase n=1 Tax=Alteribacter lacisalsi TaxID=2045244 RepID=A0A2W0H1D1_9BACI|nr:YjhG/YagF family D-xylonate dehydratase [Alteribacter lacisalsi]PYZ95604.1 YjhG/YagF family D-xylonate dehydratase [Alteribacter lacisalsi]